MAHDVPAEEGIEAEIRARDLIDDRAAYVARMKNLADAEISWQGIPWSDTADLSPTTAATCDQDQLEPILRSHAERLGAEVRFDTGLIDFSQGPDGVSAHVRDRATGAVQRVRPQYLIAADGTDSPVRAALRIARHGPGVLQHWMNRRREQFRVQLNSKDQVDAPRRAQQGGSARIPTGRIIVGTSENAGRWSWHLGDVMFVEVAIELCDGRPSDVERGGAQFGGGRFCPWSASVVSILEN
jgi:2-polyprenyl-6-methoxyphenol hydroxylase-like FAD-dependent oxidoreductase